MAKVVIADDEEFVRKFIVSIVQSLSFQVVAEVATGDEVYSVLKKTHPDILFLDINMPNLTGIEFLKRYSHEFPKTCIIILTSAASFESMEEASSHGANCFLRKDLPIEKMLMSIENAYSAFANRG